MLLRIYIGFCIASYLILSLVAIAVACELKEQYGTAKMKKRSFAERVLSSLFTLVICAMPIWHIVMTFILVFRYRDVIDRTVEDMKNNLDIEGD